MDPLQYFVQAGAFRGVEEAEQMRARLSLMGLQARVSEREQAGRVVFRVRLGPFDRREDAEKAGERLEAAGVSAVLVRVQR
jgi:cell division protein FtsN